MNTCVLCGNLARDIEIKEITMGDRKTCVATTVLAVNRYYKTGSERKQQTDWIPLEAWDSGAVTMSKILHKGSRCLIRGVIKSEQFTTKDGQKASKLKVRVEEFTNLSPRPNNGEPQEAPQEPEESNVEPSAEGNGSDIPF